LDRKAMPQQPELWIGLVEARPLDRRAYGAAGAFTYIVTWACDAAEFRKKADTIVATLDLYVASIEGEDHWRNGLRSEVRPKRSRT